MNWQNAVIIVVAGALILMAVASYASSTTGHFVKDSFNGTPLEQPGDALVGIGHWLMNTLVTVVVFMLGAGVILLGIYLRLS